MTGTGRRVGRLVRAVAAVVAIVAIVAGVPALMIALGLVPRSMPSLGQIKDTLFGQDTGQLALVVFAVGVWVCWALFTVSLIGEAAALARRRPSRAWPGMAVFQRTAAALLVAVVIGLNLASAPAAIAAAPPASAAAATQSAATVESTAATAGPAHTQAAPDHSSATPTQAVAAHHKSPETAAADPGAGTAGATVPYRVQPRDTLWGIASAQLGDPLRYPEIIAANPGRIGPDNEIYAGTTLQIPTDGGPRSTTTPVSTDDTVTVEEGDTLSGIAAGHDTTWPVLWQANKGQTATNGQVFTDPNLIWPGQQITIPAEPGAENTGRHHAPTAPDTHRADPAGHTSGSSASQAATPPGATGAPNSNAADVQESASPPADPAGHTSGSSASASQAATPLGVTGAPNAAETAPASEAQAAGAGHDMATVQKEAAGVPWPLLAGTGGVPLLAGAAFLTWRALCRRQRRWRRPGRPVVLPPPETRNVERALRTVGPAAADEVVRLDCALRGLAVAVREGRLPELPEVVAVKVGGGAVELVLARANHAAPAPWEVADGRPGWVLPAGAEPGFDDAERGRTLAPYPALVSVGYTTDGQQWLLDLEQVGGLQVSGPPERCGDLLRFMAAELAHNTWSEMLQVTCHGLGDSIDRLNPDRVTAADDARLSSAAAVAARQVGRADADTLAGTSVLAARTAVGDREVPAPHVLLVAGGGDAAYDVAATQTVAATGAGRSAVAVVTCGVAEAHAIQQATIDEAGMLRIDTLGITVTAQGLPETETAQLADLLACARSADDPDTVGDESARDVPGLAAVPSAPGPVVTVEPQDDRSVEGAGAPAPVAAETGEVARISPAAVVERPEWATLNADLADWYDPDCVQPKITLLGSVAVSASGSLPADKPRLAWHTEVVALLACRPRGLTPEQFACALWPEEPYVPGRSKTRQAAAAARRWLGADPETGAEFLPSNPASADAIYRLDGALVDADLFTLLRDRGRARGTAGVADLAAALELVSGVPFDRRRRGGYGWLADDPLDHTYSAMIIDVAHTVALHHLAVEDPQAAAVAAEVALKAGSFEDTPLLDLAAACEARGMRAEMTNCIKRIMANHDADVEEDLPPHTFAVLSERGWLAEAS